MEHIHQFKVLEKYIEGADVVDVKVFQGQTSLRAFIASMLSYYPWWVVGLYRIRKLLVGVLGLARQATPEKLPDLNPELLEPVPVRGRQPRRRAVGRPLDAPRRPRVRGRKGPIRALRPDRRP